MVVSLFETEQHPMTVFMMSLWTRNPTPCSCLSSFPLKETLCPSSVVVSSTFFHLISQSSRMFYLYLSILCISSWSFSAALSVLMFHVPVVMLSLPWICDDAPVAYLTPPSWFRFHCSQNCSGSRGQPEFKKKKKSYADGLIALSASSILLSLLLLFVFV